MLIEMRWHARAGQGIITVAKSVADVAIADGKFAQGMPEFGPERAGAPIRAYDRISDSPIRIHAMIKKPNFVIVLDPSTNTPAEFLDGSAEDATVIVNSKDEPAALRKKWSISGRKVGTIDADGIAKRRSDKAFTNVPMLGAVVKALGIFKPESFKKIVEKAFGPEAVADFESGFQEVRLEK